MTSTNDKILVSDAKTMQNGLDLLSIGTLIKLLCIAVQPVSMQTVFDGEDVSATERKRVMKLLIAKGLVSHVRKSGKSAFKINPEVGNSGLTCAYVRDNGNQEEEEETKVVETKKERHRIERKNKEQEKKGQDNLLNLRHISEVLQDDWNKKARSYGFKTVRIISALTKNRIEKINRIFLKEYGPSAWRIFFGNIDETMDEYSGEEYVKYFTFDYIFRDSVYPYLVEHALNTYQHKKDPSVMKKMITEKKKLLNKLLKEFGNVSDKLDENASNLELKNNYKLLEKQIADVKSEIKNLKELK